MAPPPVAAAAPAPPEEHEAAVRAMQAGAAAVKFAPEGTDGAAAVEGRLYLSDDRASLVFETHSRGVDVVVPLAEVEDVVYGQRTATYTAARRHATDDFRPGKGRALSNRGAPAPRTSKRATRAAPDLTPRSHPAAGPAALSFSLVRASATHDFCFTAADDACEAFVVGVARLVGAPLSRRDYCWRRTELKMMAAGAGSRSFADASRGLRAHADAERQRLAARTATAAAPPRPHRGEGARALRAVSYGMGARAAETITVSYSFVVSSAGGILATDSSAPASMPLANSSGTCLSSALAFPTSFARSLTLSGPRITSATPAITTSSGCRGRRDPSEQARPRAPAPAARGAAPRRARGAARARAGAAA